MFAGRFSSSLGLVGIDFGSCGVKMLQVREHGGKLEVVGATRLDLPVGQPTPPPASERPSQPAATSTPEDEATSEAQPPSGHDALTDQLGAAFATGGFVGRKCVVSLPRQDICVQSIRLPKMPDDELRQSAVWEASQRFGFDRQAMEVDFIRTGATLTSGENRDEVILIAASHAAIHARVEPLMAAGLRPVAVDTGFAALVRTFSRQVRRESDSNVVRTVVEIGYSGTTVLILRGDQIAFCKPINISGFQFTKAVAEHLQMSEQAAAELRAARITAGADGSAREPADSATDRAVYEAVRPLMGELVKEVTLCLRYYGVTFRGHPPEQIILTGGDGLEPKLGEVMEKVCKIPVLFDDNAATLGRLIGQIQRALNRTPGPAPSWAVAVGLSLRGIVGRSSRRPKQIRVVARGAR